MSLVAENGFRLLPGRLDPAAQRDLLAEVMRRVEAAPFYRPVTPGGKPMSVRMTNFGPLGWVTDAQAGYRYQPTHPQTGEPWPDIPPALLDLWREAADAAGPPDACLVNLYDTPKSRMGLHRDEDEEALDAPVISISLGDSCVFRVGGFARSDKSKSFRLASGDVAVIGGASRLRYHGVDRVIPGSSQLVPGGGRINLTLRRVTKPSFAAQ